MDKVENKGMMDLESGERYYTERWMLNCHACGTTYSPLKVNFIPLDFYTYRHGYFNRFILLEILDNYNYNTNCLSCRTRHVNINGIPYDSTVITLSTVLDQIEGRIDPMMNLRFTDEELISDGQFFLNNKEDIIEQAKEYISKWYHVPTYLIV